MELTQTTDPFAGAQGAKSGLVPIADPFDGDAATAPAQDTPEPASTPVKFSIGDTEIEMPDVPEEQRKQILDNFRQTPEFDALVDKETGASKWARTLVGSAPEKDRLANLKQVYSDAVPYGEGNFVFTNPETGKPTLYNPEGFDTGDIFSVAREGSQAIGATMGAVAGGVSGLATGPGAPLAVPTAAALGAGLGSETGAALFDAAFALMTPRVDSRGLVERSTDTAMGFMAAASGQKVGDLVGPAIAAGSRSLVGGSKQAAAKLFDQFKRLRIEPPAGAVSTSKAVQTVEKMLESSPVSASIMQENAERVITQTQQAAEKLAREFGDIKTKQGAGGVIKEAAVKAAERFGFRQEAIYDKAFNAVGKDWPVRPDAVRALRAEMQAELSRAPNSLKKTLTPALNQIDAILLDADAGLPFDALRQVRTMIGKNLASPMLTGSNSAQNSAMKRGCGSRCGKIACDRRPIHAAVYDHSIKDAG
mgnify:FL=1